MPKPLRTLIANKLEKSGVLPLQTAKIRGFMPMGRSDVTSMYDEFLPPGLLLGSNMTTQADRLAVFQSKLRRCRWRG